MSVLFRVDAGHDVGLGHLQRCLSLGKALEHMQIPATYLTNQEDRSRRRIEWIGFPCVAEPLKWNVSDAEHTVQLATAEGCNGIVVDSDHKNSEYLEALGAFPGLTVALDDNATHPFPCDVVVNGNAHATRLPYSSTTGATEFLLGPKYMILRPEFWQPLARQPRARVEHILVTVGGSDAFAALPALIRRLDEERVPWRVTVVVGPYFTGLSELNDAAAVAGHLEVHLVQDPLSMRHLMVDADLAVSAGGQTLYELAAAGCPTLALEVAENQRGQMEALEEDGVVELLGHCRDPEMLAELPDRLRSLADDHAKRCHMLAAGQRLVDGRGSLRVARFLSAGDIGMHRDQSLAGTE